MGKSGLKALQYMGMGVPVVASAIGAACEFIRDGDNGFLVRTDGEWIERLGRLIEDSGLRTRMGMAGRATVEASFSVRGTAPTYRRHLASLWAGPSSELATVPTAPMQTATSPEAMVVASPSLRS
jgi:glycosyltransferase involved in cell wall biosynthesis